MLHWSFAAVIFTFFNDMKEAEPGQNVLGKTLFSQTIKIGTIGSIPLKDPNFRYIPWTHMSLTHVDPHVSEIVMIWIQNGDLLMV
jgi:hypothetical protein